MTNNLPIPPRSPVVAKYLDHYYFKPAMTQGSGGMGRLIFALDARPQLCDINQTFEGDIVG